MMQERRKLNEKGMPYWNTLYDWMYSRLAKKNTGKYVKKFPYPENKNRGKNGRIKEYRNGNKCPT